MLAVLVVHGDQPWHDAVASRLGEWRRAGTAPPLIVVANDAPAAPRIASDLSATLVELARPHGSSPHSFGEAVAVAVNHPEAAEAEFVLLLHDDLVLDPDALPRMLDVMASRPEIAVTGPKLLEWRAEPVLQQVGMTIDALGRAETHLHDGEVDQGQHDHRDRTLYVSTAGMLVRTEVFRSLGGFDPRFSAMREDLDLCWRAWLAGYEVEVVPDAVGWHVAAAARSVRQRGIGRRATTRYLAERHTLAAMIKNFGAARLAWTLPLYLVLAFAKSLGFLLTRQVASAAAPLAALAWNVRRLPGTLRLRAAAQRERLRGDGEISDLLARGSWRTWAYGEALADWLRGSDTRAFGQDEQVDRRAHRSNGGLFRAVDTVRDHPALVVGTVLAVVWVVACVPLLGGGQLIGGQVAAWPPDAAGFMEAYVAGWGPGPLASGAFNSPVQPLLALLSGLVGGTPWAAQRLVVLGLVPLAWLASLRAGRLITARPVPRVIGATVYTASPVVLGAFAHGRLDALTVAALLPMALPLAVKASGGATPPGRAWRAAALLAVIIATAVAVAPSAWPVVVVPPVAVAVVALPGRSARSLVLPRLLTAGLGAGALLLPWLLDRPATPAVAVGTGTGGVGAPLRMWEALSGLVVPLPGWSGAGWLWLATFVVTVLTGAVVAIRRGAATAIVLLGSLVAFAAAAVFVARVPEASVPWPPLVAVPATLALGGLSAVAVGWLRAAVRGRRVGVRHGVATAAIVAIAAGPVTVASAAVAVGDWPVVHRDPLVMPLFVQADAERVGPYRVLVLDGDENAVSWDVAEPDGPRMTAFGTGPDPRMVAAFDGMVEGLLSGHARAVGQAGLLGVRYVVMRDDETRAAVAPALADLAGVEPLAAGGGRVYDVRTWLPRAAVVDGATLDAVLEGQPVRSDDASLDSRGVTGLDPTGVGRYAGGPAAGDVLVVSEAADASWTAHADGRPLERAADWGSDLPLTVFALDGDARALRVAASPPARPWWLAWQAAVLLALLSLALRAPGHATPAIDDARSVDRGGHGGHGGHGGNGGHGGAGDADRLRGNGYTADRMPPSGVDRRPHEALGPAT